MSVLDSQMFLSMGVDSSLICEDFQLVQSPGLASVHLSSSIES